MAIESANGKVTFLRVHDGGGWGPAADHLDVDVVFRLDTPADHAFGFTLRNDASRPSHQGMLDLLRDAFEHGWTTHTEYEIAAGKKNGKAIRVWLTK
jgi:hypothetical protein